MEAESRIIVALDQDLDRSLLVAEQLGNRPYGYKIHWLFDRYGPRVITELRQLGAAQVCADAKICEKPDIAVRRAAVLRDAGADLITLMACGGARMISAIRERVPDCRYGIVTVPSWLGDDEVQSAYGRSTASAAGALTNLAKRAGAEIVICSPLEVATLAPEPEFKQLEFWVVGIRPAWAAPGDQKRFATPAVAVRSGAVRIVIGDPITGAADPAASFDAIVREIAAAMAERR